MFQMVRTEGARQPIAVYVHCPFCPSKCGYCDFNSYAGLDSLMERTAAATRSEIRASALRGTPAKTVFFGGGTPTSYPPELLLGILEEVLDAHPPIDGCEISCEANPGAVDAAKFASMRRGGFNRVSLGAQSFRHEDLVQLGRVHGALDVGKAISSARAAGFDNVNLDLMFALPGQSLEGWESNVQRALSLAPDHLSLYGLTIEPNTRYGRYWRRGQLDLPGEDAQVRMYDRAVELTAQAGFSQYEISNFALPGRECRHNLCYWRAEPYAGYGPGAVGAILTEGGMARHTNQKHPARYCQAVEDRAGLRCEDETLTGDQHAVEAIMLGLRLNEGIDMALVCEKGEQVAEMAAIGWVELAGERLRLTSLGRHLCTEVTVRLI